MQSFTPNLACYCLSEVSAFFTSKVSTQIRINKHKNLNFKKVKKEIEKILKENYIESYKQEIFPLYEKLAMQEKASSAKNEYVEKFCNDVENWELIALDFAKQSLDAFVNVYNTQPSKLRNIIEIKNFEDFLRLCYD
jgi:hypothetical protein